MQLPQRTVDALALRQQLLAQHEALQARLQGLTQAAADDVRKCLLSYIIFYYFPDILFDISVTLSLTAFPNFGATVCPAYFDSG